jgi:tRNA pseudouridine synthase 10
MIPAKDLFRTDSCRFSSAGREDIDVRMLGDGRPFVVELINPRVTEDALRNQDYASSLLETLRNRINQETPLIRVERLFLATEDQLTLLKEGENTKRKTYRYIGNIEYLTIGSSVMFRFRLSIYD